MHAWFSAVRIGAVYLYSLLYIYDKVSMDALQ